MPQSIAPTLSRVGLVATTAAASAAGAASATGAARPAATTRARADTVQSILDTALLVEQLSAAWYYAGLTAPAVLRTRQLGGRSSDPNNPGLPPNGNPHQMRYLQAALDAEVKHVELLAGTGARSQVKRFYVPAAALRRLGTSVQAHSFLGVLDQIETLSIGLYLAAVNGLLQHHRLDLAQLAGQLAGVEAEHRMLGRAIANLIPANNLTLEKEPFALVGEAYAALRPFLDGRELGGPSRAIAVPTRAQATRVIGPYGTRRVHAFL